MAEKMTTLCKKLFGWLGKNKKTKPYIRFYSLTPGVVDLFPIVRSSTVERPYRSSQTYEGVPPSKNCPAINKIVGSGWIVPAPADFIIDTNGDGTTIQWLEPYRFKRSSDINESSYVVLHSWHQTDPLVDDPEKTVRTVVKLETPWRVDMSDDYVLLQLPVTYNKESRFTAAIGVLDPEYGYTVNVQLFWNVKEGRTLVKAGTPLCQLVPVLKDALSPGFYDVIIDNATEQDQLKDREFNYAASCVILNHDSLGSRLSRSKKILNKYKK